MGLKVAVASGNWSNPATWNGGVLPGPGDVVASNGFTVTIDQNVTIDTLTNGAVTLSTAVPIMTSNSTPSGIVTYGGAIFTSYGGYTAFNGNVSNVCYAGNTVIGDFIAYEFTSPKKIGQVVVYYNGGSAPNVNYSLDAWDGTTWVTIGTFNTTSSSASPMFTNTTAYIKYRVQILTAGVYVQINEFFLYEALSVAAVAGGGFVVNSSATITCTSTIGITGGSTTAPLTISATSPAIVNVNSNLTNYGIDNSRVIAKTGNCTLNIVGSTRIVSFGSARHCLVISSTGTTNFVGGVTGAWSGSNGILMTTGSAGAILNIVGDINPAKYGPGGSQNAQHLVVNTVCTVNVTGNIYGGFGNDAGISVGAAATIYVTGNVYGGQSSGAIGSGAGIVSGQAHFLSVIGTIYAQHTAPFEASGIHSTSTGAINLFSGPFVSGPYGGAPLTCVRMHLIPSAGNYFEFRDETTNGAVSPGAIAPAARLVSPATLISNLAPADVRFGTTYALGTLTGTLRMPTANQVTYGVAVDNTFGNAVLTAASIWDYLVSNITVENSIGMRLKNVSTPQITGEQLEAFLRLD